MFIVFPFLFQLFIFYGPTHHPPPATRHPLPATRLPANRYPSPATRHPSPATRHPSPVTRGKVLPLRNQNNIMIKFSLEPS